MFVIVAVKAVLGVEKMNEYQKAYDRLAFNFGLDCLDEKLYPEEVEDFELFQELINEFEAYKKLDEFVKNAERFYTNEDYFKIILKAISKCKDKYLADNAVHCLSYLKYQLEGNPALKVEELKEGMWVWDDVEKEFLKVKCVCVAEEGHYIFKEGTKIIEFVLCGISSRTVDVEFEPNRFYRKQVEE